MELSRRGLLRGLGSVSSAVLLVRSLGASETGHDAIELTQEHLAAVNRRRRIVVQDDPANFDPEDLYGMNFEEWIAYRFSYADQPGSQIDSIWWDLENGDQAVYRSKLLPRFEHPGMRKWWDQGIDWVAELIKESRKRNLEVFWHHRVNKVDIRPLGGLEMEHMHPVKKEHPDWVIGSWWWQGPCCRSYCRHRARPGTTRPFGQSLRRPAWSKGDSRPESKGRGRWRPA